MDEDRNDTPRGDDPQAVAALVRETMAERTLSQSEIAAQVGVSASALSGFLAGRYKGDNAELSRKLRAWHAQVAADSKLRDTMDRIDVFVTTPVAQLITQRLELAKALGCMTAIAGQTGIGKTRALTAYAARMPSVWYSEFSKDQTTIYATLKQVARVVGLSDLPRAPDDLRHAIEVRLQRTRGLLICDEAQNMSRDGMEQIRTIFDRLGKTGTPIGVAFAGHPDLMDRIGLLDQLDGRIQAPLRLGASSPADADALFDAWELACPRSRTFLREKAGQRTGLRRVANAFKLAALNASAACVEVGIDHVRDAWATLNVPTA